MKTKKFLKIALLVVIAALFIWTFVFLYQKSQPKVTVYETIVPEVTDLEKTTVATGKVEPRDEVLIKPLISGIIAEVYKEAGQSVKQGEVLAKVKVIPELGQLNSAESRVRLAEINAAQAETDFARTQKLYNDKLISAEEYEKGEVSVKQAREELQTAKDNLEIVKEGITKNSASFSSTLIRSTITGLILDVPIKVGNSVIMSNTFNDGTTIATVANMNERFCRAPIVSFTGMPSCTRPTSVSSMLPRKIKSFMLATVPTSLKSKLPLPHRTAYRYVPAILPTQKSYWTVPRKRLPYRKVPLNSMVTAPLYT